MGDQHQQLAYVLGECVPSSKEIEIFVELYAMQGGARSFAEERGIFANSCTLTGSRTIATVIRIYVDRQCTHSLIYFQLSGSSQHALVHLNFPLATTISSFSCPLIGVLNMYESVASGKAVIGRQ